MTYDDIVGQVMESVGTRDRVQIERAISATMEALGERLDPVDAGMVAEGLPHELAEPLRRHHDVHADFDVGDLYRRISSLAGIRLGLATEEAQVICRVVAQAASREALAHLRHLPMEFAVLFGPRPGGATAPHRATPPGAGRTLATGRPGSMHPVSESAPHRTHDESVASAANPHADSKISSSQGMTQERDDQDLAAGKAGSERPLSQGKS